jgi:hypothetical protein
MPQIDVTVTNLTKSSQVAHVFDTFTGGTRAVAGSPFTLAVNARSPAFKVNADKVGHGTIAYRCESGASFARIDVTEGANIDLIHIVPPPRRRPPA